MNSKITYILVIQFLNWNQFSIYSSTLNIFWEENGFVSLGLPGLTGYV